jgi:high-affinity nickel permease
VRHGTDPDHLTAIDGLTRLRARASNGVLFASGHGLVDGLDGYLAASTLSLAAAGDANARFASQALGVLVVICSFALGGAELLGYEISRYTLPLGIVLFVCVIAIRMWARSGIPGTLASAAADTVR